jgi:diguanylate cyclase (GGDEF)-like protein
LLKLSIENKDEYLKEKYYNEILEVTKQQKKAMNKDYSFYIMNHMKNEVDTIHNLKKVKIFYGIMLIVIVSIIIISNIVYKKIKYRITHDDLTKVSNRYLLDKNYKLMLRKNKDFAAIMIDIDNFKNINDTYGHGFGDTALIKMCKVIKAILNKNSALYRYGGEEFAVLIKHETKAEVFEIAEKIRYYVEAMLWENDIKVTISIGIAFSSVEKELTIQRADENLYKAKSTGKNKVVM